MMNTRRFAPATAFAVLTGSTALAGTLHVPDQYSSIQSAVDAAVPGDQILIASGVYAPFTVTTDDLTIREVDEDSNPLILIPPFGPPTFEMFPVGVAIQADRVTVEGLSVDGTAAFGAIAFQVTGDDNTLRRNHADVGPLFIGGGFGFESIESNRTVFDGNIVPGIAIIAFRSTTCADETYVHNQVHDAATGFVTEECTSQTYKENTVSASGRGFYSFLSGGASYRGNVMTGAAGFTLSATWDATIRDNSVEGDGEGVGLRMISCDDNDIRDNTVTNCFAGIWLSDSYDNTLRNNVVTASTVGSGFILDQGSDWNDLIGNLSADNMGFGYRVVDLLSNSFRNNEAENNHMGDSNQPGVVD